MTTQPPPSRYRVVEKGRRLIVIDSQTGEPARTGRPMTSPAEAPLGPERIAFDGRSTLVTRRFYDDKGPRRLILDEGATRYIEGARTALLGIAAVAVVAVVLMPGVAIIAVPLAGVLLSGQGRAAIRAHLTRWLDRYDDSAG